MGAGTVGGSSLADDTLAGVLATMQQAPSPHPH